MKDKEIIENIEKDFKILGDDFIMPTEILYKYSGIVLLYNNIIVVSICHSFGLKIDTYNMERPYFDEITKTDDLLYLSNTLKMLDKYKHEIRDIVLKYI